MRWPIVCIFAVLIGVYVGIINQIPLLYDTSFQDIAVTMEWWVLFAVFIVSNCRNAWEAGCKYLVFFLISQSVIYLVELPSLGWNRALYYYARIWLPISLLTLPGGVIAFFAKKQNTVGAVILAIGNTIVALMGVSYFLRMRSTFPRHLLTVISCAAILAVIILGVQQKRRMRLFSLAVTVLLTTAVILWTAGNGRSL